MDAIDVEAVTAADLRAALGGMQHELAQTRQALREQQELLHLAQVSAHLGIWDWDVVTNALTWTPELEHLYGLAPGSFAGTYAAWQARVHPDDRAAVAARLWEAVCAHQPFELEFRMLHASGGVRWIAARGQAVYDAAGAPRRVIAVHMDITAREQTARDLQYRVAERTAQLEESNRELEAFSYSVSHDLRAPLLHLKGFAQLLLQREAARLDATSTRYVQIIAEAAMKMGQLIEALLHLSQTSRAAMHLQPVALEPLVRDVVTELEASATGRTMRWHCQPLPTVVGDLVLLRQVFVNLLGNAVKYTRPRAEAHIHIGTRPGEPGEVICTIRDNGVGFDPAYTHKLFGVFQRLHNETAFEGTGVGLANVRRIIRRHGGRIWAEGALDQGTTFSFTLPLAPHP